MTPKRTNAEFVTVVSGFGLLEGPTLLDERRLLVSDVQLGGVYIVDLEASSVEALVPHRKGIGGICLHEDGAIVTGRNVSLRPWDAPAERQTVLLEPGGGCALAYNDLTVDRLGRIFVGSLAFRVADGYDSARPGCLHRIDVDGTSRILDDDILLSNGLAFAPDGRSLYVADSVRRLLWRYDVDSLGELSGRKVHIELRDGLVDGIAVDQAGDIWIAMAHRGAVHVVTPEGEHRQTYDFPTSMTTSLCFGLWHDTPVLYVVSGSDDTDRGVQGGVFRMTVDTPGATVWHAAIQTAGATT